MNEKLKNHPLNGIGLDALLGDLVREYGWDILAEQLPISCFKNYPSFKSSVKFLKRTEWGLLLCLGSRSFLQRRRLDLTRAQREVVGVVHSVMSTKELLLRRQKTLDLQTVIRQSKPMAHQTLGQSGESR